jgi:hypothetical protein
MQRQRLELRVALADQRLTKAARLIRKQRELIALRRSGHRDTARAEKLLDTFTELERLFLDRRNQDLTNLTVYVMKFRNMH